MKSLESHLIQLARTSALATLVCGSAAASNGVINTFFGEDLGVDRMTALPASPLSDAARTAFLSGLGGVGTEDFESFMAGDTAPLAVQFGMAGTATIQGTGGILDVPAGTTNGFGRYAVSGTKCWEATTSFSIDFSTPQAAFGFYGVDIGDFGGQVTVELNYTNGGSEVLVIPNTINGNGGGILYFGLIIDDPMMTFDSVTFGNTAAGTDFFAFDDFTIGTIDQVGLGDPICSPAVANSTGQPGIISAAGSDVAADNDVTLFATQLPANSNGFFITSQETNIVVMPGGSVGNICIASFTIGRYDMTPQNSGANGEVSMALDLTNTPLAPGGPVAIVAGQTWYWQYWYRDIDPLGVATSNFTNATEIAFL